MQEMQEVEERRLLEMFKCPRLCEFQHQTHIQIITQFSLFIVNNNPIPSSISPHICSDVKLSGLIDTVSSPELAGEPNPLFMGVANEDAHSTATPP